jgi:hypothetical protein
VATRLAVVQRLPRVYFALIPEGWGILSAISTRKSAPVAGIKGNRSE